MRVLAEILFICLNVIMAGVHANIIKRMERETLIYGFPKSKIKHGWWAWLYYGIAAVLSGLWFARSGSVRQAAELFLCSAVVRKFFFDTALNVFRFGWRELFYVTPEVWHISGFQDAIRKGKTFDWLHYKIFGKNSQIYMTLYFLICLFFAIYFLTQNPPSRWTMNL